MPTPPALASSQGSPARMGADFPTSKKDDSALTAIVVFFRSRWGRQRLDPPVAVGKQSLGCLFPVQNFQLLSMGLKAKFASFFLQMRQPHYFTLSQGNLTFEIKVGCRDFYLPLCKYTCKGKNLRDIANHFPGWCITFVHEKWFWRWVTQAHVHARFFQGWFLFFFNYYYYFSLTNWSKIKYLGSRCSAEHSVLVLPKEDQP